LLFCGGISDNSIFSLNKFQPTGMCYHLSIVSDAREVARKLGKQLKIKDTEYKHKARYHVNGFDNPLVPVIAASDPDYLRFFRWRLIPSHVEDVKQFKANTLNARSEEIFEKSSYRDYWQNRCLVLSGM
jgi:putative SOS response-associated peptidase YedK